MPSSGRQAYAITRTLNYNNQADQPRISEMMNRLVAKLHVQPQVFKTAAGALFRFQFDNGHAVAPPGASTTSCVPQYGNGMNTSFVRNINASGNCDVVFNIDVTFGISRDHAKTEFPHVVLHLPLPCLGLRHANRLATQR